MAVIKNLAFCQKGKIKKTLHFKNSGAKKPGFTPFPVDLIHYLLPLRLKFLEETFVALDKQGSVKGLVSLEREFYSSNKLKIVKFFLEENSFSDGEQLINFIVSKYCALGASAFQVTFPEGLENMLNLFVNICKFRICAHEHIYKADSLTFSRESGNYEHFKRFRNAHKKAVCELHNTSLNSHQRHSFIKHPKYFEEGLFAPADKTLTFKYVLEDVDKGNVYAYFTISSQDGKNWTLEMVLSPAFDGYLMDIIYFSTLEISRRSRDWTLYIKLKTCYINFESLERKIKSHKFEFYEKNLVLTRDFLRPQKQEDGIFQTARIIFGAPAAGI